ncbi:sensor histidine kinase [Leucobacter komagatae]|uniref:sensor histidine kinase n=1 Tax=Leucobacter komagatae TaxID=55969 RepID=UPI00069608C4|nr:histidine kinase [Leucobacter komagatae]
MLALSLAPLVVGLFVDGTPLVQSGNGAAFMVMFYAAVLPLMVISSLWFWRVVARLEEARLISAELAVTQERLRFAADLHDIQGHHLQVIALKAELAERTIESNADYAAGQIGEIRLIAKEAMEETRSLVAGLREVALGDELENASEVLTLAGTKCTLSIDGSPTGAEAERVLAFAVREATTNILRHSEASTAAITLAASRGGYELLVVNDGVGGDQHGSGSGLAGLRERVIAIGGTLEAQAGAGATGTVPRLEMGRLNYASGYRMGERSECDE